MTRNEILSHYTTNEHGIITSLGKFEGEMLYVPYFWDLVLNGCGEDGGEESNPTSAFDIDSADRAVFPELAGTRRLVLSESDQGFVYCDCEE